MITTRASETGALPSSISVDTDYMRERKTPCKPKAKSKPKLAFLKFHQVRGRSSLLYIYLKRKGVDDNANIKYFYRNQYMEVVYNNTSYSCMGEADGLIHVKKLAQSRS